MTRVAGLLCPTGALAPETEDMQTVLARVWSASSLNPRRVLLLMG